MKSENDEYTVKFEQFTTHYHYLLTIMHNQAKKAKTEEQGYQFRWIIPAMSFSVFTIESLSNLYGSQIIKDWYLLESTSFLGKIIIISDFLGVEVDWSREPWQTLNKMKDFRNNLVHLKPKKSKVEYVKLSKTTPKSMLNLAALIKVNPKKDKKDLMNYSNFDNMKKFIDTTTNIEQIWMRACLNKKIELHWFSNYKAEIIDPSESV